MLQCVQLYTFHTADKLLCVWFGTLLYTWIRLPFQFEVGMDPTLVFEGEIQFCFPFFFMVLTWIASTKEFSWFTVCLH